MNALKLTFLLLFAAGTLFSQKASVETASIAIAKYSTRSKESKDIRSSYIKEAKTYIDKAHLNETTSNYMKMWFVRGKVYYYLYVDTLGNKSLDPDAIEKAVESLVKWKKTDVKGKYERYGNDFLARSTALSFNEGYNALASKDYDRALRYFNGCLEAIPHNNEEQLKRNNVDANKVRSKAALAAMNKGDNETAKKHLQLLIDQAYADPNIFLDMKNILLSEKDTAGALDYLTQGRNMFEDNMSLILAELNTYLVLDKPNILIDRLNKAIEADPYNPIFFFNLGYLNDKKADKVEEAAEKEKVKNEAVANYEKAIELNPSYFDALFNLGALYYNQGAEYVNEANQYGPREKTKTDAALANAKTNFEKAQPHLELAHELKEEDKLVAQSLMQLYLRTEQMDKWKAIKEKFEK